MKANCQWKEKMHFVATADGHEMPMDAKPPIGSGMAPTPKQLVLAGLCGCTAMDVVALMKKHKQPIEAFDVEAETENSEGNPAVFTDISVTFRAKGAVDADQLREAVALSQTKYCGVSAMLSQGRAIRYEIELNGTQIGVGESAF